MGFVTKANKYLICLSNKKIKLIIFLSFLFLILFISQGRIFADPIYNLPPNVNVHSTSYNNRFVNGALDRYPDPQKCKLITNAPGSVTPVFPCNTPNSNLLSNNMPIVPYVFFQSCSDDWFNANNPSSASFLSVLDIEKGAYAKYPQEYLSLTDIRIKYGENSIPLQVNHIVMQCIDDSSLLSTTLYVQQSSPKQNYKFPVSFTSSLVSTINVNAANGSGYLQKSINGISNNKQGAFFLDSSPITFNYSYFNPKTKKPDFFPFVKAQNYTFNLYNTFISNFPNAIQCPGSNRGQTITITGVTVFNYHNLIKKGCAEILLNLDFNLSLEVDVTGKVLYGDTGSGVPNTTVYVHDITTNETFHTNTNSSGNFSFTGNNTVSAQDQYTVYTRNNNVGSGYNKTPITAPNYIGPGNQGPAYCDNSSAYNNQIASNPTQPNNQDSVLCPVNSITNPNVTSLPNYNSYNFVYKKLPSLTCSSLTSNVTAEVGEPFDIIGKLDIAQGDNTSYTFTLNSSVPKLNIPNKKSTLNPDGNFNINNVTANNTGSYSVSGSISGTNGASIQCAGNFNVVNKPFLKVYGANVIAGSNFSINGGCNSSPITQANIYGNATKYSDGIYRGSSSDHATFATGTISGFATHYFDNTLSEEITIPGYNPPWGGQGGVNTTGFSSNSSGYCVPDYYQKILDNNISHTTLNNRDSLPTNGQLGLGDRKVYISTGNIVINQDTTFAPSIPAGTSSSNLPMLYVIAKGGDIYIDKNVGNLAGVYIAEKDDHNNGGHIYDCSNQTSQQTNPFTNCTKPLVVEGSFIADQVVLDRTNGTAYKEDPNASKPTNCNEFNDSSVAEQFCTPALIWLANPFTSSANINYMSSVPPTL